MDVGGKLGVEDFLLWRPLRL
jgi:hypothetical protein